MFLSWKVCVWSLVILSCEPVLGLLLAYGCACFLLAAWWLGTGASKRVCTCGAIHVPQYVQLCDMNRYVYLYQGIWAGDDRPDNCYSLPNDSIASNSGNATDCTPQKLLRKRLHYAICPSGYCKGLKVGSRLLYSFSLVMLSMSMWRVCYITYA